MRSWWLLPLAVLVALGAPASAQSPVQTVSGVVATSGDRSVPLAGAEVLIGARRTSTDAQGRFRLDSMPPGEYDITLRHIGYRPVRSKVVIAAGESTVLEYFMKYSPYLLPEVVVESRRTGIYGLVRDLVNRPIPGARIEVLGLNGSVITSDSLGRFAMPEARRGGYLIRVTRDGYVERRLTVEVQNGRGRDVTVQLAPGASRSVGNREATALFDLRQSLAVGTSRSRMMSADLARYQSISVCDVPRVKMVAGSFPRGVLNGEKDIAPGQLCFWHMDEIAMIQFVPGTTRFTSAGPVHEDGYVILWEKW